MSLTILAPILSCLGLSAKPRNQEFLTTYEPKYTDSDPIDNDEETEMEASRFIALLLNANSPTPTDPQLRASLKSCIGTSSWTERFAKLALTKLEAALRKGAVLGKAAKEAAERAGAAAFDFAKEHPVYATIIALGVLVVMAPWVLEVLGFAELGPVEGESCTGLFAIGVIVVCGRVLTVRQEHSRRCGKLGMLGMCLRDRCFRTFSVWVWSGG